MKSKSRIPWFVRFIGWGLLMTIPCVFLTRGYRTVIGEVLAWIFSAAGHPMRLAEVGVGIPNDALVFDDYRYWIRATCQAPVDLALFAAMCLASVGVSLQARLRSLLAGMGLLVVGELVMLSWCIVSMLRAGAHGELGFGSILTWTRIMGTLSWVGPLAVWVLLLGRSEPVGGQGRTLGELMAGR
jgi:hypothetical protein